MEFVEDDFDIDGFLEDSTVPVHQIEDNLFLGNIESAKNQELLKAHNIQSIVQCLGSPSLVPQFPEIEYHIIPIDDTESADIGSFVPMAVEFIHNSIKQNKNVLVHCAAGVSRSASITISYIMAKYQLPFQEAFQFVRSKRRCICPNKGFRMQLCSFDLKDLASYIN